MDPEAVRAEADMPDPRQHRRIGPINGAKPKQPMFETPNLLIPGYDRPPMRAGTQLVTDRFMDEPPTVGLGDIEALFRRLLPTAPVQTPPPHPVRIEMEIKLERILSNVPAPALPSRTAITEMETLL